MEERIMDRENERKIKVKKTVAGGIADAVEEGLSEGVEEEVTFELPDVDEMNEDLIGLSAEQMRELQKKREEAEREAIKERDKMLAEGERLFKLAAYQDAEPFFAQALLYDPDNIRANEALWICRTEDFSKMDAFYDMKCASAIAESSDKTKEFVRRRAGGQLAADRRAYEEEAAPLKERVTEAQSVRRAAFERNRKYYLIRFSVFMALIVLFLVAAIVSANFIVRTTTNLPVILAAVFGGVSLLAFLIAIFFARKLIVAQRYCHENKKLSSTEDGARLEFLLKRLKCLALILDDRDWDED